MREGCRRLSNLRDASGKLIAVEAGEIRFDENGIVRITPNLDKDHAAIICTALGGNPA